MPACLDLWDEQPQDLAGVTNHWHVRAHILADFGGIDVDVNDPCLRREAADPAGGPVVEPGTDRTRPARR